MCESNYQYGNASGASGVRGKYVQNPVLAALQAHVIDYRDSALFVRTRQDALKLHEILKRRATVAFRSSYQDQNERSVFYPGRTYDVTETWCPECEDWRSNVDDDLKICADCIERRKAVRIAGLLTPEAERSAA